MTEENHPNNEELKIDKDIIQQAEKILPLEFTDQERELMLKNVNSMMENTIKIREFAMDKLSNEIPPSLYFMPMTNLDQNPDVYGEITSTIIPENRRQRPENLEVLAFYSVGELAYLIRNQIVTSSELTQMYLNRIERYNPVLHAFITVTDELALEQARIADEEIQSGQYISHLHGIPYGVKDLLSYPGYKTTWGATPYKEQTIETVSTVIHRLEAVGAVLLGKLSMGALAWGDVWFDHKTLSPWNLEEGSSGSSAGSAAATAAGLVGFSIGTETYGSIVSPSTKCGTSGLRPTFGRVSRHGAMALSWSMDKIGPICRNVEDCALVFSEIIGKDPLDPNTFDAPFAWDGTMTSDYVSGLKIAYLDALEDKKNEFRQFDLQLLDFYRSKGIELSKVSLPDYPVNEMSFILNAEAATAFDVLTITNKDDELVSQQEMAWPNFFRAARFIPAVEYLKANRLRTLLIQDMEKLFEQIDVMIAPSFSNALITTNLTGHPCVVLPTQFRDNNIPASITFIAGFNQEEKAMQVAKFYQQEHRLFKDKNPNDILDKALNS